MNTLTTAHSTCDEARLLQRIAALDGLLTRTISAALWHDACGRTERADLKWRVGDELAGCIDDLRVELAVMTAGRRS